MDRNTSPTRPTGTAMKPVRFPTMLAVGYEYTLELEDGRTLTAKITRRAGNVYTIKVGTKLERIALAGVVTAERL